MLIFKEICQAEHENMNMQPTPVMKALVSHCDLTHLWFRQKISRVSPEVVDIPTVETVVEINEKEQSHEPSKDDTKDTTPPQGRLPPLQPLTVIASIYFTVIKKYCNYFESS